MGFGVWANRVAGASNAEGRKMTEAYRKHKERIGYVEVWEVLRNVMPTSKNRSRKLI